MKTPDVSKVLDQLAGALTGLADRAATGAKWLARLARIALVLGVIGGACAVLALFAPGFGWTNSWVLTILGLTLVAACAAFVRTWIDDLRSWNGDVHAAVQKVKLLDHADEKVKGALAVATGGRNGGGGALRLVRSAWKLRPVVLSALDDGRETVAKLTGPFRPPFVVARFAALVGGPVIGVAGPIMLLIALAG